VGRNKGTIVKREEGRRERIMVEQKMRCYAGGQVPRWVGIKEQL